MEENEELKVIYVLYVGEDGSGDYIYHLLLSDGDIDYVLGEDWGETPAGICNNLTPPDNFYSYVKEFKTNIVLDLAQNNSQLSMQDVKEDILALAWENISEYEEYPEPCRIVIHYGDTIDKVDEMLSEREIKTKFI